MPLWTPERHRRLGGPSLAIVLALLVGGACSSSATPAPAASVAPATLAASAAATAAQSAAPSVAATASVAPTAPPVAGGDVAQWCAFVIEINTKYGYMKDKAYSTTVPSMDVWRQIITEALSRLDEWMAVTPPEIKDATAAEIAWFQAVKAYGDANGWPKDSMKYPQLTSAQITLLTSLTPYQETKCGIKFPV